MSDSVLKFYVYVDWLLADLTTPQDVVLLYSYHQAGPAVLLVLCLTGSVVMIAGLYRITTNHIRVSEYAGQS